MSFEALEFQVKTSLLSIFNNKFKRILGAELDQCDLFPENQSYEINYDFKKESLESTTPFISEFPESLKAKVQAKFKSKEPEILEELNNYYRLLSLIRLYKFYFPATNFTDISISSGRDHKRQDVEDVEDDVFDALYKILPSGTKVKDNHDSELSAKVYFNKRQIIETSLQKYRFLIFALYQLELPHKYFPDQIFGTENQNISQGNQIRGIPNLDELTKRVNHLASYHQTYRKYSAIRDDFRKAESIDELVSIYKDNKEFYEKLKTVKDKFIFSNYANMRFFFCYELFENFHRLSQQDHSAIISDEAFKVIKKLYNEITGSAPKNKFYSSASNKSFKDEFDVFFKKLEISYDTWLRHYRHRDAADEFKASAEYDLRTETRHRADAIHIDLVREKARLEKLLHETKGKLQQFQESYTDLFRRGRKNSQDKIHLKEELDSANTLIESLKRNLKHLRQKISYLKQQQDLGIKAMNRRSGNSSGRDHLPNCHTGHHNYGSTQSSTFYGASLSQIDDLSPRLPAVEEASADEYKQEFLSRRVSELEHQLKGELARSSRESRESIEQLKRAESKQEKLSQTIRERELETSRQISEIDRRFRENLERLESEKLHVEEESKTKIESLTQKVRALEKERTHSDSSSKSFTPPSSPRGTGSLDASPTSVTDLPDYFHLQNKLKFYETNYHKVNFINDIPNFVEYLNKAKDSQTYKRFITLCKKDGSNGSDSFDSISSFVNERQHSTFINNLLKNLYSFDDYEKIFKVVNFYKDKDSRYDKYCEVFDELDDHADYDDHIKSYQKQFVEFLKLAVDQKEISSARPFYDKISSEKIQKSITRQLGSHSDFFSLSDERQVRSDRQQLEYSSDNQVPIVDVSKPLDKTEGKLPVTKTAAATSMCASAIALGSIASIGGGITAMVFIPAGLFCGAFVVASYATKYYNSQKTKGDNVSSEHHFGSDKIITR